MAIAAGNGQSWPCMFDVIPAEFVHRLSVLNLPALGYGVNLAAEQVSLSYVISIVTIYARKQYGNLQCNRHPDINNKFYAKSLYSF